jgi:hypothetical protein
MDIPPVILQFLAEFSLTVALCIVIIGLCIFIGHFAGGLLEKYQ